MSRRRPGGRPTSVGGGAGTRCGVAGRRPDTRSIGTPTPHRAHRGSVRGLAPDPHRAARTAANSTPDEHRAGSITGAATRTRSARCGCGAAARAVSRRGARTRSEPVADVSRNRPLARAGRKISSYGGRPPSAGSGNTSWMASVPPTATCGRPAGVVGARRLDAVAAVDEHERGGRRPVAGDRRATRPTTAITWSSSPASWIVRPEGRQRVHLADAGVDDGRVVPLPAGLVLLRPAVVVDGEHHGAGLTGGGAEPDRRAPAVRADLDERCAGHGRGGGERGGVQRVALVGRHEPLGGQRVLPPVRPQPWQRRLGAPEAPCHAAGPRQNGAVQAALDDLVTLLDLEPIEVNIFRGRSPDENRQRVFGGQVAGQALVAAARTVDDPARLVHSLHAYFLRPGDPTVPILYEVDRIRDGRSFTTRRVVAIQHGRAIFNLQASFHVPEPGPDHQVPMPARTARPGVAARLGTTRMAPYKDQIGRVVRPAPPDRPALRRRRPDAAARAPAADSQRVWLRADGHLPDDPVAPRLHRHLRQRHDAARHDRAAVRAGRGTARACRWPASTTRCGSTGRSAPTSGCCTTSTPSSTGAHAAWPAGRSSPPTAAWWSAWSKRAWSTGRPVTARRAVGASLASPSRSSRPACSDDDATRGHVADRDHGRPATSRPAPPAPALRRRRPPDRRRRRDRRPRRHRRPRPTTAPTPTGAGPP